MAAALRSCRRKRCNQYHVPHRDLPGGESAAQPNANVPHVRLDGTVLFPTEIVLPGSFNLTEALNIKAPVGAAQFGEAWACPGLVES